MPKDICTIVRRAEENYVHGTTHLGEHVDWSMFDTIERIFAYLNSRHISGKKDSRDRDKPFFNIVSAAVNVWYRATDIDRKDLRFIPENSSSILLAFIANVLLQNWMDENNFGQFLNQWGRTLAQYGSAVLKFVERDGKLIPSVVAWNRLIPDSVDFNALPRIEKFYKTPAQLQEMATPGHPNYSGYYSEAVENLVAAASTRKTLSGQEKDNMSEFIELYEVHGLMDTRMLEDDADWSKGRAEYRQQMHVVSFVAGESSNEYKDFTLYRGREAKDPYMITHLIEEDGRSLSIGAVEYLFESQWMQNHAMKAWKDNMDLTSKKILQTADTNFVGRNVLSAVENGDILIHKENMPLTSVAVDEYDLTNVQNFANQWRMLANEITSTPDAIKGNTLPSGTPYSLGAYLGGQANSLFEIMTENKGLALEKVLKTFVIPHIKKQLKNKDEIVGILDDAGITEIDSIYVPSEAVRRFNKRTMDMLELSVNDPNAPLPQPFDAQLEEQSVKQGMTSLGNKRFFKPDELGQKQWDEVFKDFEWESIRIEVSNENVDKQAVLQTLATLYTNTLQTDPVAANIILAKIMVETGVMSPLQVSSLASRPLPSPTPSSGEGINNLVPNQ